MSESGGKNEKIGGVRVEERMKDRRSESGGKDEKIDGVRVEKRMKD